MCYSLLSFRVNIARTRSRLSSRTQWNLSLQPNFYLYILRKVKKKKDFRKRFLFSSSPSQSFCHFHLSLYKIYMHVCTFLQNLSCFKKLIDILNYAYVCAWCTNYLQICSCFKGYECMGDECGIGWFSWYTTYNIRARSIWNISWLVRVI